ncbi:MAG: ABC transporter permease [Kineosporiaceae bacterium]|nr:ABC transporter permease [Kineosporiaceae bacterium]MBK8075494.1 ABC transporter permease [Kineosporiaceae bacterium]
MPTPREAVALFATVRKESLVMLRYWPNTVMLLLETILMPLAYWAQAQGFEGNDPAATEAFAQRSGTDSLAGFIYLGWAVFMWVTTMIWGPGAALRAERMQGSLESLFLTPVSRFTLLYGPSLAYLIPTALEFAAVGLMLRLVFGVPLGLSELLSGIAIMVASMPVLFALGGLVNVLVMWVRDSAGFNGVLRGLIGLLCGITYPVAVLPGWLHPVSHALPVTVILDTLRGAMLGLMDAGSVWSRSLLLLGTGLGFGVLALIMLDVALRAVRRSGRLGQF